MNTSLRLITLHVTFFFFLRVYVGEEGAFATGHDLKRLLPLNNDIHLNICESDTNSWHH